MSKIQRYDIDVDIFALHGIGVSRCSDGDWVKWEDAEALVKENALLKIEISELQKDFADYIYEAKLNNCCSDNWLTNRDC